MSLNKFLIALVFGIGALVVSAEEASACNRRSYCYTSCDYHCGPVKACYCWGWYCHQGNWQWVRVYCAGCPSHLPGWCWGYIKDLGIFDCVRVYYCYPTLEELEKAHPQKQASAAGPGAIQVALPADAKLMIDDQPTTSTSSARRFTTTELKPGYTYYYTLKAEVVRDGRVQTVTQKVEVRANQETRVTLELPTGTAAVSK